MLVPAKMIVHGKVLDVHLNLDVEHVVVSDAASVQTVYDCLYDTVHSVNRVYDSPILGLIQLEFPSVTVSDMAVKEIPETEFGCDGKLVKPTTVTLERVNCSVVRCATDISDDRVPDAEEVRRRYQSVMLLIAVVILGLLLVGMWM